MHLSVVTFRNTIFFGTRKFAFGQSENQMHMYELGVFKASVCLRCVLGVLKVLLNLKSLLSDIFSRALLIINTYNLKVHLFLQ